VVLRRWRFLSASLAPRTVNVPSVSVPVTAATMCCPSRVLVFSSPLTWPTRAQDPAASVTTSGTADSGPRFFGDTPAAPLRTASRTVEAAILRAPGGRSALAAATMESRLFRFCPLALASTASLASMVTFLNASVVLRFSPCRCFSSCSTWPGLRRYAHLSFFGFCDAGPLWGFTTRGCPALTRAPPRL
jgi:hypothetical protein